jgi:hypothetical protein
VDDTEFRKTAPDLGAFVIRTLYRNARQSPGPGFAAVSCS